jgi:hypothetical protein
LAFPRSGNQNGLNVIKLVMEKLSSFCQKFGLHPLTALGLFAVDWMLFAEEVATAGTGWIVSLPVGVLLGFAAFLIQRHLYKDEVTPAVTKALVVAFLTAIPAPLSSMGILPLAAFGAIQFLSPKVSRDDTGNRALLAGAPRTSGSASADAPPVSVVEPGQWR